MTEGKRRRSRVNPGVVESTRVRAVFGRARAEQLLVHRAIALAVRDWERAVPSGPAAYPSIVREDILRISTPARFHGHLVTLDRAVERALLRLARRPDFTTITANLDRARACDSAAGAGQSPKK